MPYPNTPIVLYPFNVMSVGDNIVDLGEWNGGKVPPYLLVKVRATSLVTGPVTVRVEYSDDAGATWGAADPAQTMTAITVDGSLSRQFPVAGPRARVIVNLAAGSANVRLTAMGIGI